MEERSIRNDFGEAESLILPFAFRQLQDSSFVSVKREFSCCWKVYSVSCPDTGTLFTMEGIRGFNLNDSNGKKLAQIQQPLRVFAPQSLRVVVSGSAPVTVGAHERTSRAVLIQDGGRTVLRIRKPLVVMHDSRFEITSSTTNTAIGDITKDGSEYDVRFPDDIDVRYKAALIASCVYIDTLPAKRPEPRTTTDGVRIRTSNTYVNFQDNLLNSLRISDNFAVYNSI